MVHIFIFRRDFRLQDNLAFHTLLEYIKLNQLKNKSNIILPIFIFNDKQINKSKNKYYSNNSVEFMIQSLHSLNEEIHNKLQFFHTQTNDIDVLKEIQRKLKRMPIESISFNIDVTPYAIKRDEEIIKWCKDNNIDVITKEDYTLLPLNHFTTTTGNWFSVFTPYYRKFLLHSKDIPKTTYVKVDERLFYKDALSKLHKIDDYYQTSNQNLFVQGGRKNALKIIDRIKTGYFENYDTERDLPAYDGTTKLSAYLKFGCISIREVYEAIKETYGLNHGLIRELIWRDFYANITFNKPRILEGQIGKENLAFKEKYDKLDWEHNKEWLNKWQQGKTGVPLVDAAMRQMLATGWMHNRCRMVVASYLCKDMLMDWRLGEEFFASHLVDYDPSSNNGGWQFCSSTGVDAQPYFRIFNPYTQSKRFDPNCDYIKKWIPELKDIPKEHIHAWDVKHMNYNVYYPPMLEHNKQTKKALVMYQKV